VLQGQHGQGQRGVVELAVELLEQVVDDLVVGLAGGDEQGVDTGVGEDDGLLALEFGRGGGLVALGEELVERGGEDPRIGVFEGDDADADRQPGSRDAGRARWRPRSCRNWLPRFRFRRRLRRNPETRN
jgi:hypothetical protein